MHLADDAADLRMDRHRRNRRHMADRRRVNLHRHICCDRLRDEHRRAGGDLFFAAARTAGQQSPRRQRQRMHEIKMNFFMATDDFDEIEF